jgi:hypothetical protein
MIIVLKFQFIFLKQLIFCHFLYQFIIWKNFNNFSFNFSVSVINLNLYYFIYKNYPMDYFCQILRFCLINLKTCYLILFTGIIRFFHIHLGQELCTFRIGLETLFYLVDLRNYRLVFRCLETSLFDLVLNANWRKRLSDFDRIFLNCFFKIGFCLPESARFIAEELQKINQFFIELTYLYYDSAMYCLSLMSLFYGFIQKNFRKFII